MDKAHPIYVLLCRYSVKTRLIILSGLVLFTAHYGMIPTDHFSTKYVLWGSLIAICTSPLLCLPYVTILWAKITPIKDRVTYYENEIVFLTSIFAGTSFLFFLTLPIPPAEALRLGGCLTAVMIPFSFIVWALNSTFAPLKKRDLSENVKIAQTFRDETPNFWRNIFAYGAAGVASAIAGLLSIALVSLVNGRGIPSFDQVPHMSSFAFIFMGVVTAPLFVLFGRLMIARQSEPLGRHFAIGGIVSFAFIAMIDLSSKFFDTSSFVALGDVQNAITIFASNSPMFLIGGYVFSKLYKPRSISMEFV